MSPEGQHNNSSTAIGSLHIHASAHLIGKHPSQGQADATAGNPRTVAAATETLEHGLSLIRRDAGTMVTNAQTNHLRIHTAIDLNL